MGVRSKLLVVAGTALAVPLAASGATQQPAANVKAEGNPFTGGLAFDPKSVSVKVGQIVRWTNTDDSVPHTATEDHELWNLTGTYGIPGNTGFGPGESRQRRFEASTAHYFCKIHPSMRGVVKVPVSLSVKTTATGRRITVRWAAGKPAAGLAYGVQVKKGDNGKWKPFRINTTSASGTLDRSGAKIPIRFRARLRKADDVSKATGWSPVAKVNA